MHHLHSHTGSTTHAQPETKGLLITHAGLYSLLADPLVKRSNPTILKMAGVKPGTSVLDVACGTGSLTLTAKKMAGTTGEVWGIDASAPMIEEAKQHAAKQHLGVNFELAVAESLPFEDNTFDVAISRLAFHHLPGELKTKAAAEIYRVLKPGGVCMIVDFEPKGVPGPNFLKTHLIPLRGMWQIDITSYLPILEANNFKNIETGPTGHRILSYVKGVKLS